MYSGAEEPGGLTLAMTDARKQQHMLSCVTFTVELPIHKVFSFSTEANSISVVGS